MAIEIIVEFPSLLTDKEKKMIYGYKGEVVRCKDCKRFRHDDVFHRWYCSIGMTKRATSKDDYCSMGERREDAD